MHFSTTVKVTLAESATTGLQGVKISLYDRDRLTKDDFLGSGVTDENGEVHLDYDSSQFVDLDERLTTEMPDLYVVVQDAQDQVVVNTRAETLPNTPRKRITVAVPRDLAVKHNLIPESAVQG